MLKTKKKLIFAMQRKTKKERKELWKKLKGYKLTKPELIKIIRYSYDPGEIDCKILYEMLHCINPSLTRADLILIYGISKPLYKLFQEEKHRLSLVA